MSNCSPMGRTKATERCVTTASTTPGYCSRHPDIVGACNSRRVRRARRGRARRGDRPRQTVVPLRPCGEDALRAHGQGDQGRASRRIPRLSRDSPDPPPKPPRIPRPERQRGWDVHNDPGPGLFLRPVGSPRVLRLLALSTGADLRARRVEHLRRSRSAGRSATSPARTCSTLCPGRQGLHEAGHAVFTDHLQPGGRITFVRKGGDYAGTDGERCQNPRYGICAEDDIVPGQRLRCQPASHLHRQGAVVDQKRG